MDGENRVRRQRFPLLSAVRPKIRGQGGADARPAVRSRLAGLLSRRNTASHRCAVDPGTGRSPSARSRTGRDVRGFPPPFRKELVKTGPPHGQPRFQQQITTTYGGITHIRLEGRGAQPPLSPLPRAPLFLQAYYGSLWPVCQVCFGEDLGGSGCGRTNRLDRSGGGAARPPPLLPVWSSGFARTGNRDFTHNLHGIDLLQVAAFFLLC